MAETRARPSLSKSFWPALAIFVATLACGGGGSGDGPPPPPISVSVSPATASVTLGATQQFTATVVNSTNAAVSWSVNGIPGGNATVGTISATGLYTAPQNLPSPATVTVQATSAADPTKSGASGVTITSNVAVAVSPSAASLRPGAAQQFTATVMNSTNTAVSWSVNSIPGGNATVGTVSNAGLYTAPLVLPSPNPVSVTATSVADSSRSATALATILADVAVSPASVTLRPLATQQFTAAVTGVANQAVNWSVSGAACNGPGAPCGSIDAAGFYTAPAAVPSPPSVTVTAASVVDPARTGSASVTIVDAATGPAIAFLFPASVTAGVQNSFLLRVQGSGFLPSNPGPGSSVVFNGTPKSTNCSGTGDCTATILAAEVAVPGSRSVQILNPGSPPTFSNQVFFLAVAPDATEDIIQLTAGSPTAAGRDIAVVEPTTAGTGAVPINVAAVGSVTGGNCSISGNSITILRPAAGSTVVRICVQGTGLDPTHTYTISGPSPNDITIAVPNPSPLGSASIALDLTISGTTQRGPRTLFVENQNRERAAASGGIEVK